jgi:molecular chaperone DnaK (HSP70)
VEAAKRNLSTANDVDIEVESLVDGANFSVKLTRAVFEKLCAPLFVRCIDTVKSVIRDAGATLELVTDVVLVGGSTRVPALQSQVLLDCSFISLSFVIRFILFTYTFLVGPHFACERFFV